MTWEKIFFIVVCVLAFIAAIIAYKKYGVGKDQFDERQELIRKKAWKYSAMTMLFAAIAYYFLGAIIKMPLMAEGVGGLLIALLGTGVFAIYSIFNDSFFAFRGGRGIFDRPGAYAILLGFIVVTNGISAVNTIREHKLVEDGLLTSSVSNLALAILFLAILIALGVKYYMNKNESRRAEQ